MSDERSDLLAAFDAAVAAEAALPPLDFDLPALCQLDVIEHCSGISTALLRTGEDSELLILADPAPHIPGRSGRARATYNLREGMIASLGAKLYKLSGYDFPECLFMARQLDDHGLLSRLATSRYIGEDFPMVYYERREDDAGELDIDCKLVPEGPRPAGMFLRAIGVAGFLFRANVCQVECMALANRARRNLAALAGEP